MATTDGSDRTIPLHLTYTRVLEVPRSIPTSLENELDNFPKTICNSSKKF